MTLKTTEFIDVRPFLQPVTRQLAQRASLAQAHENCPKHKTSRWMRTGITSSSNTYKHCIQLCFTLHPDAPCQTVVGTGASSSGASGSFNPLGISMVVPRTISTTARRGSAARTTSTTLFRSTEAAETALSPVSRCRVLFQLALVALVQHVV